MKAIWRELTEKPGLAWGWLRAKVRRSWTAIRRKLTGKLGRAWSWLRARAWHSGAAIRQKLDGTPGRVIGAVVAALLIIVALVFVPQYQVASIADDAIHLELENDARRTLAQIVGGAVGLAVIWITWQRLQVAREELQIAREGQITERFSRAIEHLGSKESLDVRVEAIYALERTARESRQDHGPIMEILTAYVRERAQRDRPSSAQQPAADDQRPAAFSDEDLLPTSALATDIQAALTVLGRRRANYDPPGQVLNLMRTNLCGANLIQASLQRALLGEADLQKAKLWQANLQGVRLSRASLREANLSLAMKSARAWRSFG